MKFFSNVLKLVEQIQIHDFAWSRIMLRLRLDISGLLRQRYDGGSNMAWKINGLQQKMIQENPKALYCLFLMVAEKKLTVSYFLISNICFFALIVYFIH